MSKINCPHIVTDCNYLGKVGVTPPNAPPLHGQGVRVAEGLYYSQRFFTSFTPCPTPCVGSAPGGMTPAKACDSYESALQQAASFKKCPDFGRGCKIKFIDGRLLHQSARRRPATPRRCPPARSPLSRSLTTPARLPPRSSGRRLKSAACRKANSARSGTVRRVRRIRSTGVLCPQKGVLINCGPSGATTDDDIFIR